MQNIALITTYSIVFTVFAYALFDAYIDKKFIRLNINKSVDRFTQIFNFISNSINKVYFFRLMSSTKFMNILFIMFALGMISSVKLSFSYFTDTTPLPNNTFKTSDWTAPFTVLTESTNIITLNDTDYALSNEIALGFEAKDQFSEIQKVDLLVCKEDSLDCSQESNWSVTGTNITSGTESTVEGKFAFEANQGEGTYLFKSQATDTSDLANVEDEPITEEFVEKEIVFIENPIKLQISSINDSVIINNQFYSREISIDTDVIEADIENVSYFLNLTDDRYNVIKDSPISPNTDLEFDTSLVPDGKYKIFLSVRDLSGQNILTSEIYDVNIDNTTPKASIHSINNKKEIFTNTIIELDASTSSDSGSNIESYNWDLDNDGLVDHVSSSDIYKTQMALSAQGTYTVSLYVEDKAGNVSDKVEQQIAVSPNVVISELMRHTTLQSAAQWFGLTNNSDSAINLQDWAIEFGIDKTLIIAEPIVVEPYTQILLCNNIENVVLQPTLECSNIIDLEFVFNAEVDRLAIVSDLQVLTDQITWNETWNGSAVTSIELQDVNLDNNIASNWIVGEGTIGSEITPSPTIIPSPTVLPTTIPTSEPEATNTPVPTEDTLPTVGPQPTNTIVPTKEPLPTNTIAPTNTPVPTNTSVPTKPVIPTVEPTIE